MKRRTLLALASCVLAPLALTTVPLATARAQQTLPNPAPTGTSTGAPVRAALTAQDRADLARIETYLDGLHTLKGRFLQVASDGQTAQGEAWLERPGRLRFQYDPPSPLLLVAGHGLVVFHDSELNQTSNFPISSTPLGILLADHVTLSGNVTVTAIAREPGQIQVTMVRTASPGDGSLTLIFADQPLALRQWAVVDAQGRETRVSLFNIEYGGHFDQKLFEYVAKQPNGPGAGGNN